jgi:hypothetical protein
VKDYKQAKAHLIKNGCRIVKEFDGSKALYFTDPFGLTIDIIDKNKNENRICKVEIIYISWVNSSH